MRNRKKRQGFSRVAIHTSPVNANLSKEEMSELVHESLIDAFLPKMLYVASTPERADTACEDVRTDPYWQSKFRSVAKDIICKKYNNVLPLVSQYQLDTKTVVSCIKVCEPIEFDSVYHWESDTQMGSTPPISDLFFGLSSEKQTPEMRSWDDIPWMEIGIVPKDIFYRFIKILLDRLSMILRAEWGNKEYGVLSGYEQDFLKGTYFESLQRSGIVKRIVE